GNTAGGGVSVGVFTLGDLHELLDDVRRRRTVRIAHAEVDDVLATAAGGHLELGGDVEDVGGETIDARKTALGVVGHAFLGYVSARNRPSDVGRCCSQAATIRLAPPACPVQFGAEAAEQFSPAGASGAAAARPGRGRADPRCARS